MPDSSSFTSGQVIDDKIVSKLSDDLSHTKLGFTLPVIDLAVDQFLENHTLFPSTSDFVKGLTDALLKTGQQLNGTYTAYLRIHTPIKKFLEDYFKGSKSDQFIKDMAEKLARKPYPQLESIKDYLTHMRNASQSNDVGWHATGTATDVANSNAQALSRAGINYNPNQLNPQKSGYAAITKAFELLKNKTPLKNAANNIVNTTGGGAGNRVRFVCDAFVTYANEDIDNAHFLPAGDNSRGLFGRNFATLLANFINEEIITPVNDTAISGDNPAVMHDKTGGGEESEGIKEIFKDTAYLEAIHNNDKPKALKILHDKIEALKNESIVASFSSIPDYIDAVDFAVVGGGGGNNNVSNPRIAAKHGLQLADNQAKLDSNIDLFANIFAQKLKIPDNKAKDIAQAMMNFINGAGYLIGTPTARGTGDHTPLAAKLKEVTKGIVPEEVIDAFIKDTNTPPPNSILDDTNINDVDRLQRAMSVACCKSIDLYNKLKDRTQDISNASKRPPELLDSIEHQLRKVILEGKDAENYYYKDIVPNFVTINEIIIGNNFVKPVKTKDDLKKHLTSVQTRSVPATNKDLLIFFRDIPSYNFNTVSPKGIGIDLKDVKKLNDSEKSILHNSLNKLINKFLHDSDKNNLKGNLENILPLLEVLRDSKHPKYASFLQEISAILKYDDELYGLIVYLQKNQPNDRYLDNLIKSLPDDHRTKIEDTSFDRNTCLDNFKKTHLKLELKDLYKRKQEAKELLQQYKETHPHFSESKFKADIKNGKSDFCGSLDNIFKNFENGLLKFKFTDKLTPQEVKEVKDMHKHKFDKYDKHSESSEPEFKPEIAKVRAKNILDRIHNLLAKVQDDPEAVMALEKIKKDVKEFIVGCDKEIKSGKESSYDSIFK